jgi:excisionase family DNA binding protein
VSQELTMKEVCGDLKISQAKLYLLLAKDKTFVTYKVGGSRRMSKSDLEAWKQQQKEENAELVSAA